jgi:hypothetical protein
MKAAMKITMPYRTKMGGSGHGSRKTVSVQAGEGRIQANGSRSESAQTTGRLSVRCIAFTTVWVM